MHSRLTILELQIPFDTAFLARPGRQRRPAFKPFAFNTNKVIYSIVKYGVQWFGFIRAGYSEILTPLQL